MTRIFISYARSNREFADRLSSALRRGGADVWWDRSLIGGDQFHTVIEQQIDSADKVLVVWSQDAIKSYWVRDEAQLAIEQRKYVPVAVDDCVIPLGFRSFHTIRVGELGPSLGEVCAALGMQLAPEALAAAMPASVAGDNRAEAIKIELTLEEAFTGANFSYPAGYGSPNTLAGTLALPAGIAEGTKFHHDFLQSEGAPVRYEYVVTIKPHEFFQRDGADLFARVPVEMTLAVLGGLLDVPKLVPGGVRLTIPAGVQTGQQFRLRGQGMPVPGEDRRGDMYVQVDIEAPRNLTAAQKELLQQFARESGPQTSPDASAYKNAAARQINRSPS